MNCTTLSQIFIHLQTLDESIAWSKSALNARCRLCKRKGDAEKMLLCDKCDRGYHKECCQPPFQKRPKGSFVCHVCNINQQFDNTSTQSIKTTSVSSPKVAKKKVVTGTDAIRQQMTTCTEDITM